MKRVLHLNASSGGGAFVVAQRLNEALNAIGEIHSEHLVFTGRPGNYQLWSDNWIRKKYAFGLHALEKLDFLRYEKDPSVRFAFSHGQTGIDIADQPLVEQADVIHLHWINKGFFYLIGIDKLLQTEKKIIWTCHDMWPFTGGCYYAGSCVNYTDGCGNCVMLKKPSDNDLSAKLVLEKKRIFNSYTNLQFITPSRWLEGIARHSQTLGDRNIQTIPNALDTEVFKPSVTGKKENDKRTILFAAVNMADRRKGFFEFRAFCEAMVSTGFEDFRVVYIGENKGQFPPSELFEESFTGYISDEKLIAEWYAKADIYITTTNDDNLPTTVMESMACGTPVGAFSVGGIPEMVQHGDTGILVDKGESLKLATEVIEYFNSGTQNISKVRENCREFVLKNYDSELIADKHLKLYLAD